MNHGLRPWSEEELADATASAGNTLMNAGVVTSAVPGVRVAGGIMVAGGAVLWGAWVSRRIR